MFCVLIFQAMAHRDGHPSRPTSVVAALCTLLRTHRELLPLYYQSLTTAPAARLVVAAAVFRVATVCVCAFLIFVFFELKKK